MQISRKASKTKNPKNNKVSGFLSGASRSEASEEPDILVVYLIKYQLILLGFQ
jgi:hypothetical protein